MSEKIDFEKLKKEIRYNPKTGHIYWIKKPPTSNTPKNSPLGFYDTNQKRIVFRFEGVSFAVSRIAWFLFYGYMPTKRIIHINEDTTDNRIKNLLLHGSIGRNHV